MQYTRDKHLWDNEVSMQLIFLGEFILFELIIQHFSSIRSNTGRYIKEIKNWIVVNIMSSKKLHENVPCCNFRNRLFGTLLKSSTNGCLTQNVGNSTRGYLTCVLLLIDCGTSPIWDSVRHSPITLATIRFRYNIKHKV